MLTGSNKTRIPSLLPFVTASILIVQILGSYIIADAADMPKLLIAGKQTKLSAPLFFDQTGVLFAPVDLLHQIGATDYHVSDAKDGVVVRFGNRSWIATAQVKDQVVYVPLIAAVTASGSDYQWDSTTSTSIIRARIKMVREDNNQLYVATSFPVSYHIESITKPDRIFLDVFGTALGSPYTTIPVSGDQVLAVRGNQLDSNTVRIALDLKDMAQFIPKSQPIDSRIQVALEPMAQGATASARVTSPYARLASDAQDFGNDSSSQTSSTPPADLTIPGSSVHVANIEYSVNKTGLQIAITATGAGQEKNSAYRAFMLDNPNRLAFDLPSSDLRLPDNLLAISDATLVVANQLVKSIRWGLVNSEKKEPYARVVLDLNNPVSYTIASSTIAGGIRYIINIITGGATPLITPPTPTPAPIAPVVTVAPEVPGQILSGKIIVVDPGHGGHDSGALGADGLMEKDITLSIAKALRDQLKNCGATVIMTRADDTFIPLPDRSQMGIDNHADLFVSIHCDSTGARNSHAGATVYYHANIGNCKQLASAIADRLTEVDCGIKTLGIRSDYVRFPGVGFSVLRRSPEPAVLVETGYVNDDHDAAILTDQPNQKLIATGIIAGLKDFIAHQTASVPVEAPTVSTSTVSFSSPTTSQASDDHPDISSTDSDSK